MKIIVQNLAIEYEDTGTGPVLLFLHGWQDNLHTFDALIPSLASQYRVIRIDLPGFGKSEMPKEAWNLDTYVDFVRHFIQKLALRVDILVGHSFGGRITIKGVSTKNFEVNKIILIGSAGLAKDKTLRSLLIKTLAKVAGLITYIPPFVFWRSQLRAKMYRLIGSDYINAGALKETFLKIISEHLTMHAARITVPTLLIWGINDTATPIADGKKLAALIHNSQLKVINDAGHFVHQEKSQEVSKLIQAFLC